MAKKQSAIQARPMPPVSMTDQMGDQFLPAPEVLAWVREMILVEGGQLYNVDHAHLEHADIHFLWAAGGFNKAGRTVLGQCEEITFRCGPWQKGRQVQQMRQWFGGTPDFLITLDALFCLECTNADFCALVEHELYHVGHLLDDYGQLAFTKDGAPKLGIRGHDVEEFTGVVRRYGPSADVAKMVEAANKVPEVAKLNIARACGTCLLKSA